MHFVTNIHLYNVVVVTTQISLALVFLIKKCSPTILKNKLIANQFNYDLAAQLKLNS